MSGASPALERPLRVALIWNGALHAEQLIADARDVVIGNGEGSVLPLPDGCTADELLTLLEGGPSGFALRPNAAMRGYLFVGGRASPVEGLTAAVPLSSIDYGLVSFGSASVFFQQVRRVAGPPPRRSRRDGALAAAFGLSTFVHVGLLLFLFLVAARELSPLSHLELDAALVEKYLIVPPPEELLPSRMRSDSGLEDPGRRERDEPGAQRAKDKEGKVGKRDATRERTDVAGEPADAIAAQVRGMGLLGVLSGGGKNSLADALDAPSLDNLLGGLGAAQTVLGRGSGGFGLRGSGSGGGGNATGALFGAGELGTQVAGGKGLGRGADGAGAKGRPPREAQLSLGGGDARVSGYLSREQVDRVVRANQAAIKYCFESALQRAPRLTGAVNVQWRIDRQGRVASARVAKSTLGDAGVEGCIVRQVKRWQFPTPDGGEVEVTYPFIFRGQ
jgi:TonB family protein